MGEVDEQIVGAAIQELDEEVPVEGRDLVVVQPYGGDRAVVLVGEYLAYVSDLKRLKKKKEKEKKKN